MYAPNGGRLSMRTKLLVYFSGAAFIVFLLYLLVAANGGGYGWLWPSPTSGGSHNEYGQAAGEPVDDATTNSGNNSTTTLL